MIDELIAYNSLFKSTYKFQEEVEFMKNAATELYSN